jgi:tetratricopeptide (TPR) repeat protein
MPYIRDTAVAIIKRALPAPIRRSMKQWLGRRAQIVSRMFLKSQMATPQLWDEYHRLMAANVCGVILKIMARFYGDLGFDARAVPLVKALAAFRRTLQTDVIEANGARPSPVLTQFERAYALYEEGLTHDALALFETVFRNRAARRVARFDPFVKEAVVRSGELLGRHYDKQGDADACIEIYRDIMSIHPDGIIAHRLIVLLCRTGNFSEAAEFGDAAMLFQVNLFPRLPKMNRYIAALEKALSTS